jgi:hypothetical protein
LGGRLIVRIGRYVLKEGRLVRHHVLFGVGSDSALVGEFVVGNNVPAALSFADTNFMRVTLAL